VSAKGIAGTIDKDLCVFIFPEQMYHCPLNAEPVSGRYPLQAKYKLTPLSPWGKPYSAPETIPDPTLPKGEPNAIVKSMPIEEYFNYLNELLAKFPPPASDKAAMDKFGAIGIGIGKKFNISSVSDSTRIALSTTPKAIFSAYDNSKPAPEELVNGWHPLFKVYGTYGTDFSTRHW
jgi:hypothetical protein